MSNVTLVMILLIIAFARVSAQNNIDSLLVAYYPFDSNANDQSIYNNDGVVDGPMLTSDFNSQLDAAYLFDGIDDVITVADSESLLLDGDFTISAWVYPQASKDQSIIRKGSIFTGPFTQPYGLRLSQSNDIIFSLFNGANLVQVRYPCYEINTWFMVTGVFRSGIMYLYVNGVMVGERELNGFLIDDPQPVLIGSRLQLPSSTFKGIIDEVRMYSRALSFEEIASLYSINKLSSDLVKIDTSFCQEDTLFMGSLEIADSGIYYDSVSVEGDCLGTIIQVNASLLENTIPSYILLDCTDTLRLDDQIYDIAWDDGQVGNRYYIASEGWHSYTVSPSVDCYFYDSIFIEISRDTISSVFLGNDTISCDNQIILKSNYQNTIWAKKSTGSEYKVTASQEVVATYTDDIACTYVDTINITLLRPENIYIPNAITMNSDKNNCFRIYTKDNKALSDYKLSIYDRWGSQVFKSTDFSQCWDGKYDQAFLSQGIFTYDLQYTDDNCVKEIRTVGYVTLLR